MLCLRRGGERHVSIQCKFAHSSQYLGALTMLLVRCCSRRSKTWILFPVFLHIVMRLTAFILFLLWSKLLVGVAAANTIVNLWLPALPALVMPLTIATAVFIAKGPYQERVRFGSLPMSMRATFIAPHILLLLGGLAALYMPIDEAYKACDGICLTVLIIDLLALGFYTLVRKFPRPPCYLIAGVSLLCIITIIYRLVVIKGGQASIYPVAVVPYLFECAPQCVASLVLVIVKIKKVLELGEHAGSPPFMLPMHSSIHPPPASSVMKEDGQQTPRTPEADETRSLAPTRQETSESATIRDDRTMRTKRTEAW